MVRVDMVVEADEGLNVKFRLPDGFHPGTLRLTATQPAEDRGLLQPELSAAGRQLAAWAWPKPFEGVSWDAEILLDREGLYEDR